MDGAAPSPGLLALLGRERRRALRGMDGAQLVLLRLRPASGRAPADGAALFDGVAEDCDSVVTLAPDTVVLHLPGASPSLARDCLRRAMARPEASGSAALLATLPASIWASADHAGVAGEHARRQAACRPGAPVRRVVLQERAGTDMARVTADERSFLLSPLRP